MQFIGTDIHGMRSLRHPIKAWIDGVPVEYAAREQLERIADMPFLHKHVAVMPDVHKGTGSTIGTVFATDGAIIPAAVGVDIGCGMMAVRLNLTASDLPDNLSAMRSAIEAAIPHGRTDGGGVNDKGSWRDGVPDDINIAFGTNSNPTVMREVLHAIVEKHPNILGRKERVRSQLCTLGTGNHFIEVCLDTEDNVWAMLHSGSRGIGNSIGMYFIKRAKEHMRQWFINLPDVDLAYLPEKTQDYRDYIQAVSWAQDYARLNRELMMRRVLNAISTTIPKRGFTVTDQAVNCHHNYVNKEKHFGKWVYVTRKGAVSANVGQLGIIPGSMGAKSFIVRGLGNRESFCSCSHGAGRRMSRAEANKTFSLEDHAKATAGVECRKDAEVIDETPMAYKSIDDVMAAQTDLVEVVATLKQVLCVKG